MIRRVFSLLVLSFLYADSAFSQVRDEGLIHNEVQLRKALAFMQTLQRNGGWAMNWAADGSVTFGGNGMAPDDTVTVQYPATPGIGETYLEAYEVLKEDSYLQTACSAGEALIRGQLKTGGFPRDFRPEAASTESGTFDDDTTQSAARFLVRLGKVTGDDRYRQAARRCIDFMLAAQYPNGGWPQVYPLQNDYTRYITLNDNAMMDIIRTLFLCAEEFDDSRCRQAALRGADCLLALRGKAPQAGWAQQYTEDGKPASARPFEPTALASAETTYALELLFNVYEETGDKKYLCAGLPAFEWLLRSRLPNGLWARFYEFDSNRPLYSNDAGEIVTDIRLARAGYAWQGNFFHNDLYEAYQTGVNTDTPLPEPLLRKRVQDPESRYIQSRAVSESLDSQGRWLEPMSETQKKMYKDRFGSHAEAPLLVKSRTFVLHVRTILEYLSTAQPPPAQLQP